MTKHSPLIRLQNARRAYELASEACAHWEPGDIFASECGLLHECCYRVDDAKRELRAARKAYTP